MLLVVVLCFHGRQCEEICLKRREGIMLSLSEAWGEGEALERGRASPYCVRQRVGELEPLRLLVCNTRRASDTPWDLSLEMEVRRSKERSEEQCDLGDF